MMSDAKKALYVGRVGDVPFGTIKFRVRVADAKEVFGRVDVKIEPVAGAGASWVRLTSVSLDPVIAKVTVPQ